MFVDASDVHRLIISPLTFSRVNVYKSIPTENKRQQSCIMDDMQVRRRSNRLHGAGGPGGDADSGSPVKRAKTKSQSVDREDGSLLK